MKSFILGLGIGAAAGVIFAPKRGKETRTEIAERLRDAVEVLKDEYQTR